MNAIVLYKVINLNITVMLGDDENGREKESKTEI